MSVSEVQLLVREATAQDVPMIHKFVRELSCYEKLEHEFVASEEDFRRTLFNKDAAAKALICESNGKAVGYALYFFNYSTWLGKYGLYLEDLYVTPAARRQGAGTAMLQHIANIAIENDCGRFEWSVLDWNKPAIDFYERLGAEAQSEWMIYRLTGEKLINLGNK